MKKGAPWPRQNLVQILSAENIKPGATGARFVAIIDTPFGPRMRVPLLDLKPGESVELQIERETLFD